MKQLLSDIFQIIPNFKGKSRICRAVLNLSGINKSKSFIIKSKNAIYKLPNLIDIISLDLFIKGSYENGLVKFLIKELPKNATFVDVGANLGAISIPLATARPDIKIIAIEASPWIFEFLTFNINKNKILNIKALNFAVFHESNIDLTIYAPKGLFGKGSLNPIFVDIGEKVKTLRIDDLRTIIPIDHISGVKVDVEGFEYSVLKGMGETLISDKPFIIFEFDAWTEQKAGFELGSAQKHLLSNGYKLAAFNDDFSIDIKLVKEEPILRDCNILAIKY